MTKVLAFFGAFNPPTIAHVESAKLALEKTQYESVIFVPSKSSYVLNDQRKDYCFNDYERMNMLYGICETNHRFQVTDYEIDAPYQPRTYYTLHWMKSQNMSPSLLIGADQFCAMEKHWKYVPEIAKEFGIVCLTRYGVSTQDILASTPFYRDIAPYVHVIEMPSTYQFVSSTYARYCLSNIQESKRELQKRLPDSVYRYLKERNYL